MDNNHGGLYTAQSGRHDAVVLECRYSCRAIRHGSYWFVVLYDGGQLFDSRHRAIVRIIHTESLWDNVQLSSGFARHAVQLVPLFGIVYELQSSTIGDTSGNGCVGHTVIRRFCKII